MTKNPHVPVAGSSKKLYPVSILTGIVLVGFVLYFGKALFIPLSIATLISFLLYPVCAWMEKRGLPKSAAIAFTELLLMVFAKFIMILNFLFYPGRGRGILWWANKPKSIERLCPVCKAIAALPTRE